MRTARPLLVATVAGAALTLSALVVPASGQTSPPHARPATAKPAAAAMGTTSLATVIAPYASSWNSSWGDYNIVGHAITAVLQAKPHSQVGVLADGTVALTAFIPRDRAFQVLVKQMTGKKLHNERKVFKAVAKLGIPTIEQVLLYHVVPGATITAADALKADGTKLTTPLGKSIRVSVRPGPQIRLRDKAHDLRNPRVILSQTDINKGNMQIAHGISRVLLPFAT